MNKKARYICIEGVDGVGKSTQTELLVKHLESMGHKVLHTKEPGTPLLPITLSLRKNMLSNEFNDQITPFARELLSQAIRSIHLEKLILPSLDKYDFIVQDRGILSGYAYGVACGHSLRDLRHLADSVVDNADNGLNVFPVATEKIYDTVIYLHGSTSTGLSRARSSKKEFIEGDTIESRGDSFMKEVSSNLEHMCTMFNTIKIKADNKTINEIHNEILMSLGLE